ncbi:MAG: NAD(P)H-dependent flavin oxidoreductase, partial [Pseudonocardiaceae bacterium]
ADGRGMAAVLALGATGVAMGTRFLASTEMAISEQWKQRIVAADAVDAVRVPNSERVMGPYSRPGVPPLEPRALRTPLTDTLTDHPDSADPAVVGPELFAAVARGRVDDYLPLTGQTVGLINDIRPAAEIITTVLAEAHAALISAAGCVTPAPGEALG